MKWIFKKIYQSKQVFRMMNQFYKKKGNIYINIIDEIGNQHF